VRPLNPGDRHNHLTAVGLCVAKDSSGRTQWSWLCDCGASCVKSKDKVLSGNTKSCGCLNGARRPSRCVDISGVRFHSLTAERRVGMDRGGRATWQCLCVCGTRKVVSIKVLRSGEVKSCGCYRATRLIGSGISIHPGTVLGYLTAVSQRGNRVTCRCACGRIVVRRADALNSKKSGSCGCRKGDNSIATNKRKWRNHVLFGQVFTLSELAAFAEISVSHMANRIRSGMTVEQAVAGQPNSRANGWRKRKSASSRCVN
jgi:hypothetical protein